ncbi:MAG: carotenoid oxygenase family protein [Acidimicrobiales bacterium]
MDRRAFLRRSAFVGGGLLLGACGDDAGTAAPNPTSTVPSSSTTLPSSTTTRPFDPSTPYWLQGGFAPVTEEVVATDLVVNGALPPSLHGLYARNGSNPATGNSPHWFFGDGMIHGVRFEQGKAVWYGNRYVETPMYLDRREFGEFDGAPGFSQTQSNVSVFAHGGRLLALGEVGWPFEISPADLSTIDTVELRGAGDISVGPNVTAHPKRDPDTGLLHFFGYGFTPPYLTYYVASADGRELLRREEIPVAAGTMIHDFAITESDVVFWELPVVFDLAAAAAGALNPFTWDPDYGSRIGVMPLGGAASDMRWVEIDNGYVFHGTNAHRDGDRIILDVSRMGSMFDNGNDIDDSPSLLTRWEIGTGGAELTWSASQLSDVPLDLPEIDDRFTGRAHSVAWLVETADTVEGPAGINDPATNNLATNNLATNNVEINGISAYHVATGALDRWTPGPALQPNEATFVADSADSAEGEGWLLTYVWDKANDASVLAVLDATDVAAGPVATIELPQRVPFGFHGTWMPGDEIDA